MSTKIFSGKVFLLITGGSQGIGQKIAEKLGSNLDSGSKVLLLARNAENLKKTASLLPKQVTVLYEGIDLSETTAEELHAILEKSLKGNTLTEFSHAIIIHNVGSIGDISKSISEMTDIEQWRKYYDLNVFIPAILNAIFTKLFKNENIKKHVINITSLFALKPTKNVGFYCSGKAAREMIFKVFAEENPDVNVLNYSPGPVQTDMLETLANNVGDKDTKTSLQNLLETKSVLTTDETVDKFCKILLAKKYQSGDHIDFYDEL